MEYQTNSMCATWRTPFSAHNQVHITGESFSENRPREIPESHLILSAYDFSNFTKIVDIGGGYGGFIFAVLKAYPQIKGILFDLPHATEAVEKIIEDNTISDRCELVTGDFLESIPAGGDLYTLKSVIHRLER